MMAPQKAEVAKRSTPHSTRTTTPAISIVIDGSADRFATSAFCGAIMTGNEHGRLVRRQRQLARFRAALRQGKEMLQRPDLHAARNLRHDCARCIRFRGRSVLILVAPPPPATDATANLDASARRVASTIWSTKYMRTDPVQHRSHLPNYAALRRWGKTPLTLPPPSRLLLAAPA